MSKANLFGILMLYLSISVLMFVSGVEIVNYDSSVFLSNFVDVNKLDSGIVTQSDQLENAVPTTFSETSGGILPGFFDVIGIIVNFLLLVANLIFAPFGIFMGSGMPVEIAIMLVVPLIFAGVYGLISFIRSGN